MNEFSHVRFLINETEQKAHLGDGPILLRRQQGILGRGRRLGDILCAKATEKRFEDVPMSRFLRRRFFHLA